MRTAAPARLFPRLLPVLLALPLALPLALASCGTPAQFVGEQRLDKGYTAILVGIFGDGPAYTELATALVDGGVPGAVEVVDWTLGDLLFLVNLRASARNRNEAEEFAARIVAYQDEHPGRPVHLIGHSGGAGFVLMVLDALPAGRTIHSACLLAPAVGADTDLTPALRRVDHRLVCAWSPEDDLYLGLGTRLAGTWDGPPGPGAGLTGFRRPDDLDAETRRLYGEKLVQIEWTPAMRAHGHDGGHWGWTRRPFVLEVLAPAIAGDGVAGAGGTAGPVGAVDGP